VARPRRVRIRSQRGLSTAQGSRVQTRGSEACVSLFEDQARRRAVRENAPIFIR
jgi:hypothetical protein